MRSLHVMATVAFKMVMQISYQSIESKRYLLQDYEHRYRPELLVEPFWNYRERVYQVRGFLIPSNSPEKPPK